MKRHRPLYFRRLLMHLLIGAVVLCALPSCSDESDMENLPTSDCPAQGKLLAIGTLRLLTPTGYCFDLDEGHRLLPADTSSVRGYQPVEGQRAIVIFTPLSERPGEYSGFIHHIEEMLTLDATLLSSQQADTLGNDPISISEAWIAAGHLNIRYQMLGDLQKQHTHTLHAVLPLARQESGHSPLIELRHHAHGDTGSDLCSGVASFRLFPLSEWLSSHHTLRLVVKPLFNNAEQSYTLNW